MRLIGPILYLSIAMLLAMPVHVMVHEGLHCWYNDFIEKDGRGCHIEVHDGSTFSKNEVGHRAWTYGESEPLEHLIVYGGEVVALLLLFAWPIQALIDTRRKELLK